MTLDESRVANAKLWLRRDGRPMTRDTLEAALWRMTAWKGEAEMITALLDLIDEYAGHPPNREDEPRKPTTPARWTLGACELTVQADGCVLHHSTCATHPHTEHVASRTVFSPKLANTVSDKPHLVLGDEFTETIPLTPIEPVVLSEEKATELLAEVETPESEMTVSPELAERLATAPLTLMEEPMVLPSEPPVTVSAPVVEPEPEPTQPEPVEAEVVPEPVSEPDGDEPTKPCNKCNVVKPYSAFAKDKKAKLGVRTTCRECDAQTRRDRLSRKAQPTAAAAEQKAADAAWVDAVAEVIAPLNAPEVRKLTLEEKRDLILAGKMIGSLNGA